MSNNAALYDAVISGASGGNLERWITSGQGSDYSSLITNIGLVMHRLVRLWHWITQTEVLPMNFKTDRFGRYINLRAPTFREAWTGLHK